MKTNITSRRAPLSRARFHSLHAIAAAGLLLGGLGTATSRADILYMSNDLRGTISKLSSSGVSSVFANSTQLIGPTSLAFDLAGNLYVANNGIIAGKASPIIKLTPAGVATVFASIGLINPGGLAFDIAGNLYMANKSNNTIVKFTPGGVASVFASTGLNRPDGLAFDSAGNLYAANTGSNTIEKFTLGGVGSVFASTGLDVPTGLAFDREGNLYAANYGLSHTIEKFTPDGTGSVFANNITNPTALAFDSTGNLYVAENSGVLVKLTPDAQFRSFPGFVTNLEGLAFTDDAGVPLRLANQPGVVPEPSTWLTGVALSCVALLTRRRSKAQA